MAPSANTHTSCFPNPLSFKHTIFYFMIVHFVTTSLPFHPVVTLLLSKNVPSTVDSFFISCPGHAASLP